MNVTHSLRPWLPVLLTLFCGGALLAQDAKFFVESATVDVGDDLRVNVRGVAIEDLVGLQYSLAWDTEILELKDIENIVLDGSRAANFNSTQVDSGRIGFLLVDNNLQGFGLPDSSVMFTLVFDAITTVGASTTITWADSPLEPMVTDNQNATVTPIYTDGTITVAGPNSLRTFAEDARLTVAPNPVTSAATVRLQLDYAAEATLELLDPAGRLIDRRTLRVFPGGNELTLPNASFGSDGTYVVRLTTDRERIHRKILRQTTGR